MRACRRVRNRPRSRVRAARDAPPNLSIVEGDFPGSHRGSRAGRAGARRRRSGARACRREPSLQRRVSDAVQADRAVSGRHPAGGRDRHAAAGGRGPARGFTRNPEYGVLSVLIRHGADVKRLLSLPPGAFRPAPNVHSAVVRLQFHAAGPRRETPSLLRGSHRPSSRDAARPSRNALKAFPPSATLSPRTL